MSIRVKVPESAARQIQFTYSPVLETILSVSILLQPDHHPLHHEWVRETRKLLPTEMKQGLADFRFSHFSFIPPGLVPPIGDGPPDFATDLARIRARPVEDVSIPILWNLVGASEEEWSRLDEPAIREALLDRTADFGSRAVEMVRLGMESPAALAESFFEFVARYWELAFEREWSRVEPKLADTVAAARSGPAKDGLYPMLDTLRPRIGVDRRAGELRIRRAAERRIELVEDAEIVFVPSAFLWPHIGVAHDPAGRLAVLYPAPFASFDAPPDVVGEGDFVPLLRALGDPVRLQALKLIAERPRSTQELARLIAISESGMSKHLRQLADCGVLEANRDGYYLLYSIDRERIAPLSAMLLDFLESG